MNTYLTTNEIQPYADTDTLLVRAEKLNKLSEVSQVALGMCLAIIKSEKAYEPQYQSFDEYYKTLGRSKGDISKLLKVGDFMVRGQFPEETQVPYTLLYHSITQFPDKEPGYVLAAAQSNTLSELMENGRDEKYGTHEADWEPAFKCGVCGKYTTNRDNH